MRPRLSGWARAVLALAVVGAASCSAVSGLDDLRFDESRGGRCTSDAACADDDPCHVATCGADHLCVFGDRPDTIAPDPDDPCRISGCEGGQVVHRAAKDGATCGVVDKRGVCVAGECAVTCRRDEDCSTVDPCTVGSCVVKSSRCDFDRLDAVPVPGVAQVSGDCKRRVCRAGVAVMAEDDDDVPPPESGCKLASCAAGIPKQADAPAGAACDDDGGAVCDGGGVCVACNLAADCPATEAPCFTSVCSNHACGTTPRPPGPSNSLDALQVQGDCREIQCDGVGGQTVVDVDEPATDGNPCTTDGCSDGRQTETAVSNGTACGTGLSCVNGYCFGCSSVAQCPQHPNERCQSANCTCSPSSCNQLGRGCGKVDNGCGQIVDCDDHDRDGDETDVDCGGPSCKKCGQGSRCNLDDDCGTGHCVDGVCCESACDDVCLYCAHAGTGKDDGLCRPVAVGADPRDVCAGVAANTCGLDGKCDGAGACEYWPETTTCATTCSGTVKTVSTCKMHDACAVDHTVDCTPYACNGNACATFCFGSQYCAPGHPCTDGACH